MQLKLPYKKFLRDKSIDEAEYSSTAYERLEKLKAFKSLRKEGGAIQTICTALKVSRATIYRWKKNYRIYGLHGLENADRCPRNLRKPTWDPALIKIVLMVRKQNPMYGKYKITAILKRDYALKVSVSMVGRIILYFIARNEVKPASFYTGARKTRPRIFNKHARRLKRDMKSKQPGDLLQIDHMSVYPVAGFAIKHFQAICPITKMTVKQAYSSATSNVAKKFLAFIQEQLPFNLRSIQVDGGSEFRGEFEQECASLCIPLYVTPPKSPEYNGTVERANGSSKYEFYYFYQGPQNIASVRTHLQKYAHKYNTFRPHQALQYLTPLEYYQNWEAKNSHM